MREKGHSQAMGCSSVVKQPQVSLIIAVYNALRFLRLVLAGYRRQSFSDFEIVIGDDGSGPEIAKFVEQFSNTSGIPIKYVYQADEGFRKSRILNEAIRVSRANYLVFADADCVPHSNFLSAHFVNGSSDSVLCGRRVNLSESLSNKLNEQIVLSGGLEKSTFGLLREGILGGMNHWEEGIYIRNRRVRSLLHRKHPVLFGSNFSAPRELIENVNGFNEDFVGYWGEDTELQYRLQRAGAKMRWIRNLAIQYHLFHPQREGAEDSYSLLNTSRFDSSIVCRNGLSKAGGPGLKCGM
ncbi:MAG TPA: glycosyltransferase [Bryobacteraceae bacterium]|nr:glycosyltransferase [Bryobacteraceae bacterium]